jgi:hypothetical protein
MRAGRRETKLEEVSCQLPLLQVHALGGQDVNERLLGQLQALQGRYFGDDIDECDCALVIDETIEQRWLQPFVQREVCHGERASATGQPQLAHL